MWGGKMGMGDGEETTRLAALMHGLDEGLVSGSS